MFGMKLGMGEAGRTRMRIVWGSDKGASTSRPLRVSVRPRLPILARDGSCHVAPDYLIPQRPAASADEQFKVQLHADSFHSYRCDAPEPEVETSKEELIDLYQKMVRCRGLSSAVRR